MKPSPSFPLTICYHHSPMADHTRVMTLRCPQCHLKVFKYLKMGKGKLIKCFKDRILDSRAVEKDGEVFCPCGHRMGRDQGDHIKMLVSLRLD